MRRAGGGCSARCRASRHRLFLAMQAAHGHRLLRSQSAEGLMRPKTVCLMLVIYVALALGATGASRPIQTPHKLSQGQAAWQFLRAILRADYPVAYGRLAPEVQQAVSLRRFEAAARPLWKSGQRHRREIELYKLGVRLGDGGASRLFYTFSFAADSGLKMPSVLLEVTFRDTASRAILGFGLRAVKAPVKIAKPAVKSVHR